MLGRLSPLTPHAGHSPGTSRIRAQTGEKGQAGAEATDWIWGFRSDLPLTHHGVTPWKVQLTGLEGSLGVPADQQLLDVSLEQEWKVRGTQHPALGCFQPPFSLALMAPNPLSRTL